MIFQFGLPVLNVLTYWLRWLMSPLMSATVVFNLSVWTRVSACTKRNLLVMHKGSNWYLILAKVAFKLSI